MVQAPSYSGTVSCAVAFGPNTTYDPTHQHPPHHHDSLLGEKCPDAAQKYESFTNNGVYQIHKRYYNRCKDLDDYTMTYYPS